MHPPSPSFAPEASDIDPTAIVRAGAVLGEKVRIGPYAVVEDGVTLGAGCVIGAHAVVHRGTVLGTEVQLSPHAVVGGLPQDHRFDPATQSGVRMGDRSVIREGVTVHRSTKEGGSTEIGSDVYLMANSHVAHDCRVEDHAILANGVLLAGHVYVGAHAFLGGNAVFQQFVRVGESVIVSGGGRFARSVPPFVMAAERNLITGLNLIGLRRRGFDDTRTILSELKQAYRRVLQTPGNPRTHATELAEENALRTTQAHTFLRFFAETEGRISQTRATRTPERDS